MNAVTLSLEHRMFKATVLFVSLAFFFSSHLSADAASVKVMAVNGQVQIQKKGTSEWTPAIKGTVLSEGDRIQTGPDATCEIVFTEPERSAVRLLPQTTLSLTSIVPAGLDLESGKIYSLVQNLQKGMTFEVSTPYATAAVRGTGWEQSSYLVGVFEGLVQVKTKNGETQAVSAGEGIHIDKKGNFRDSFNLSAEEIIAWDEFKSGLERQWNETAAAAPLLSYGRKRYYDADLKVPNKTWRVVYIKRKKLEDATFYLPDHGLSGAFEGHMTVPDNLTSCSSSNAEMELERIGQGGAGTGQSFILKGPFVGTVLDAVNGKGQKSFSFTSVKVTEGTVVSTNFLKADKGETKTSEAVLKPSNNKTGNPHHLVITPCGYMAEPEPSPETAAASAEKERAELTERRRIEETQNPVESLEGEEGEGETGGQENKGGGSSVGDEDEEGPPDVRDDPPTAM